MTTARALALPRRQGAFFVSLLELTKPKVSRLVLVTMAAGALAAPQPVDWSELLVAMLGTLLVVGAANALNMYLERDTDALMERTRTRPLPSGRIGADTALGFGLGLAGAGLGVLLFASAPLVAALAAMALGLYVLVYTPLKRHTPWALPIGAIPGAIPPLLGWVSVTGGVTPRGLVPFLLLFAWQIPHFHAIALFRQDEYRRAGIQVLPVASGQRAALRAIRRATLALLLVSLIPPLAGLTSYAYLGIVAPAGLCLAFWGAAGSSTRDISKWSRQLFWLTLPHLVLVLGTLILTAS